MDSSTRRILVGVDPASEQLAVIPADQAARDVALVKALTKSTLIGEVSQNPDAWERVVEWGKNVKDIDVTALPADTPFDLEEWFGDEYYNQIPQARLQTAALCPESVLREFGRVDDGFGFVDYEPATWLSPDDRTAIESRLAELGYEVVQDDKVLAAYLVN